MNWEWLGAWYPVIGLVIFIGWHILFRKKEDKLEESPYMDVPPLMDDISKKEKELLFRLKHIGIENLQNHREFLRIQKKGIILRKEKEMIEIILKNMRE